MTTMMGTNFAAKEIDTLSFALNNILVESFPLIEGTTSSANHHISEQQIKRNLMKGNHGGLNI